MRSRARPAALLPMLLVGFVVAALSLPAVVRADCQPASSVREALAAAEVAYVGMVVATREDRPGAVLRVEEMWVGVVPDPVQVLGIGGNTFIEDDRTWTLGVRYLVVPYAELDGLRDNICTATVEWRAELAALRPPDAQVPEGEASVPGGGLPGPMVALITAAVFIGAVGVLAFRRRSPG